MFAPRVWIASLAAASLACSVPSGPVDAGHHDAFVARDAWRMRDDAYLEPAPPDASIWPCAPPLALSTPLSGAVLASAAQTLSVTDRDATPATIELFVAGESTPFRSIATTGGAVVIDPPLPQGTYRWRARTAAFQTPSWRFDVLDGLARRGSDPLDVDGDGIADLVVCATGSSPPADVVYLWVGRVDRTPYPRAVAAISCETVERAGDFDGDGLDDIVVSGYGSHVILFGDRCAPLSRSATLEAPGGVRYLEMGAAGVGDVDGDGIDDVVTFGRPALASSTCPIVLRYGRRTSPPFDTRMLADEPCDAFVPAVARLTTDWDGDGLVDIAVGAPWDDAVHVYSGARGHGTTAIARIAGPDVGSRFGHDVIEIGDLDLDGRADLAIVQETVPGVRMVTASSTGPLHNLYPLRTRSALTLASPGDVDGDHVDDFVFSSLFFPYVVFPIDVEGSWTVSPPSLLGAMEDDFVSAGPGDLDGDGVPDIVIGQRSTNTLTIFLGGTRELTADHSLVGWVARSRSPAGDQSVSR